MKENEENEHNKQTDLQRIRWGEIGGIRGMNGINHDRNICNFILKKWEGKLRDRDLKMIKDHLELLAIRERNMKIEEEKSKEQIFTKIGEQGVMIDKDLLEQFIIEKPTISKMNEDAPIYKSPPTKDEYNDEEDEEVFCPNWNNRPIQQPPIVSINGVSFLTQDNIGVLVATVGYGKSSIFESILSNVLNKDCDCLGFEVGDSVKKAMFIDIERTQFDVWDSWYRMSKRAEIKEGEDVTDKVILRGLKKANTVLKRLDKTEKLIKQHKPQLILIDGAKSFVTSILDEDGARKFVAWMQEMCWKYNCSFITSLHPNKQKDAKIEQTVGGGWIGRILEEECEGVLQVSKGADEIRTITSKKSRNSAPQKTSFKFDEAKGMMVSCEGVGVGKPKNPTLIEAIKPFEFNAMRDELGGVVYQHKLLMNTIKSYLEENIPTITNTEKPIKILIIELINKGFIVKEGTTPNTTYQFISKEVGSMDEKYCKVNYIK